MSLNLSNSNKKLLLYILQVITIYNAIILGWSVKKIGCRKYELSKKLININEQFDLITFIEQISTSKIIY